MPESIKVSVFGIVGSPLCVASSDGQEVYERLNAAFEANRKVTLSFHNVTALTSAFLNVAIGQLYGTFSEDIIQPSLDMENMEKDDEDLLESVVENAKRVLQRSRKIQPSNSRDIKRSRINQGDVWSYNSTSQHKLFHSNDEDNYSNILRKSYS